MRSKLSAITARTPSSVTPLAAQSRDEPEPYSLPARISSGTPSCLVVQRSVVDVHLLAVRQVARPAAFGPGGELIAEADVGQRAAHHHFMVAAARAVGIEILRLHALRDQVAARGAVLGEWSRRARCGRW